MSDETYKRFEDLLVAKGVTAYKVGKETGITTTTLTNWKKGKYVPKQDKLQRIADYFDVSIDYLITGKEPDNNILSVENAVFGSRILTDELILDTLKMYYELPADKQEVVRDIVKMFYEKEKRNE